MNSSNSKLIEVMKKRIKPRNQNNKFMDQKIYSNSIFNLRGRKDYLETKIDKTKKYDRNNFLSEDQINLRILPLIKRKKVIFKYENLIEKKNNDKKTNSRMSISFVKPSKIYSKKYLFKSPFQEKKKNKYKLKIMVDLSKKIHSLKYNEKKINNIVLKNFSRNDKNNFKNSNNLKIYLKTYANIKNIFNDIKIDKLDKTNENVKQNKYPEQKNENNFLRNIINIKERNRNARNYYNRIHINKMNKIIEKYSFNNFD